ncbi:MAG: hypothetical protein IH576_01555 [Deltaproteobacteria bacterium]|nr:hypothetical protein [Deltaproteobacteria bacterium]
MATTKNRNPARRPPEASSLMGVLDFTPRPAIVLVFLTLTIAVVGWRMFRESGVPRVNALTDEAMRLYEASPGRDAAQAPPETEAAEKRILELTSVSVDLPPAESGFVVTGLDREIVRKRTTAALRFRYEGGYYLLVVFRQDRFLGGKSRAAFPEESLLSGERGGKSFIMWERDGASFIMVSDADVTRAFGLVRRFFT